ncbi:cytochrome c-type biogenesis protein CcmH, partial [Vibrio cholerae]
AVLWLGPISVLVIGFTVIVLRSRRKARDAANNAEWNEEQEARLKALLKEEQEGEK